MFDMNTGSPNHAPMKINSRKLPFLSQSFHTTETSSTIAVKSNSVYWSDLVNDFHSLKPRKNRSYRIRIFTSLSFGLLLSLAIPIVSFASTAATSAQTVASEYAKARALKKLIAFVFLYAVAIPYFYKISGFKRSLRVGWEKQDFLETKPRSDVDQIPIGTYSEQLPLVGEVISSRSIVGPNARGETRHIVINHKGMLRFWEGQAISIIPRGRDSEGNHHKPRIYSISSSRYGDDGKGKTLSLCVRRVEKCSNGASIDVKKNNNFGICSNFLCDLRNGDKVMITGPWNENNMILGENDSKRDFIFVASSTGISPIRSFLRRLFIENTKVGWSYCGRVWLFYGAANKDSILYNNEWKLIKNSYPNQFGYVYALIRGENSKEGEKVYLHDKMNMYADDLYDRLTNNGAYIYFSGLEEMMIGIESMFSKLCSSKGVDYDEWKEKLERNGQWHVQVY